MFKFSTKINRANSKSDSLRATIPKEIVKMLELSNGDELYWNVEVVDPSEFKIFISKE